METEGLAKILLSVVWLIFLSFSFPTLQTAITDANTTIVFYPILQPFAYLLLGISAVFPFLLAYKEKD